MVDHVIKRFKIEKFFESVNLLWKRLGSNHVSVTPLIISKTSFKELTGKDFTVEFCYSLGK